MFSSSSIFSQSTRTRRGPAAHNEPIFHYLDSAADKTASAVRSVLESWFANYPADERTRLAADFRKKDDRQFLAAFWELYLHEGLRRSGFEIECHPTIAGCSTHPDFRVSRDDSVFYMEARLVGPSNEDVSARRREATIRDALDGVDSDLFFLSVQLVDSGTSVPSGRKLRDEVNAWLRELDPDAVAAIAVNDPAQLPTRRFERTGWIFDITAHPVRPARRGMPRRAIGVYGPSGIVCVDTATAIRDRLHKKAGRYDGLDAPLVPALLVHGSPFADEDNVAEALYGTECVRIKVEPGRGIFRAEPSRQADGVWTTPLNRSGKLIAGVLVGINIGPWNVNARAPLYWSNPLTPNLPASIPWQKRAPNSAGYLKTRGSFSAAEHFGLSDGWPGGESP